ncbi:putative serine threonine- kinase pats1, partial [Brachionus plicatilis]
SVKQTCIENGRLSHDKIGEIWKDYPEELHEWMLKLTEEFDLTFPVPDKKISIVPCLLPDTEPKFNWPEIDPNNPVKIKQFKVNYKFEYLPIGLFNRIQVRLFQYGDSSIIWKKGSLLKKNSHLALISQSKNALSIKIKVQGVTPENIVFVIHETIETLINDSFNGLQYDFSFPCPDCVESQSTEPYLFSSTLLKRANEMKAPFLQCRKFFHAISIQEMMAIMPIDDTNNMDLNLEYTIRDLNSLKNTFKYDIMFWYCEQDLKLDQDKSVNPLNAIKAIESQGYHVWYSEEPSVEKLDKLTSVIKQSKLVIFGVSNDFASDPKCVQIFELVKNLIKKNYLLIEFGQLGSHEWLRKPIFASACADFRIIMQDPKRYSTKVADAFESIEKIVQADLKTEDEKKNPDVFISYCWANSHEAIKKGSKGTDKSLGWLDPRSLVKFFEKNGIHAWIDVDNLDSTTQMFGEITKGMNLAKVIVACVSDEYVESQNCKLEFRFAHLSLKIPIVKAIVGLGNEWRKNEIAFLGSNYPEANFQYETPGNKIKCLFN